MQTRFRLLPEILVVTTVHKDIFPLAVSGNLHGTVAPKTALLKFPFSDIGERATAPREYKSATPLILIVNDTLKNVCDNCFNNFQY